MFDMTDARRSQIGYGTLFTGRVAALTPECVDKARLEPDIVLNGAVFTISPRHAGWRQIQFTG